MKDKVIIITGGTRGIGLGIAKAFVNQGSKVVINYCQNKEASQKALKELDSSPDQVIAIQADISQKKEREKLIQKTLEKFKRIDVLVNNAAISTRLRFLKTNEEEFDRIIGCNLKGPIFLAKLAAEQMIKQGEGGSIINVSSSAGHRGMAINYGDAKAALLMATKNMALELGKYKIRVNSISPGFIKTDLNRHNWGKDPASWESATQKVPLLRGGLPEEVGGAALYLASDSASFTTGADIAVDGGYLAGPLR